MLSRIANNLYWAGRYLERIEHTARFVPVNYFSGLDGPDSITPQYTLETLNTFAGSLSEQEATDEKKVLANIAFDKDNSSSIISCASLLRENCRGARDLLSTELWESVNRLYLFVQQYPKEKYLSTHMHDFMTKLKDHVALCKAKIESTLIQNEVWSILALGLLVERSIQISRIMSIKIEKINEFDAEENKGVIIYELSNMLKSLESYDMNRKYYNKPIERRNSLEFLFFNKRFPRSLYFCIAKICIQLGAVNIDERGKQKSVKMIAESLKNDLQFTRVEEVEDEPVEFLRKIQSNLFLLNNILVSNYFVNT